MLKIAFWAAVHFITFFLIQYAYDGPKFTRRNVDNLRMPSVTDLDRGAGIYDIDKYTKDVICPSYHYFVLLKELSHGKDSSSEFASTLIVQVSSFLMFIRSVFHILTDNRPLVYAVIFGVSAAASFLICSAISRYYDGSQLSIPDCKYDEQNIRNYIFFNSYNFNVSESCKINNSLILCYHEYLLRIKESVINRISLAKVLNAISFVIYLLFFFRTPD